MPRGERLQMWYDQVKCILPNILSMVKTVPASHREVVHQIQLFYGAGLHDSYAKDFEQAREKSFFQLASYDCGSHFKVGSVAEVLALCRYRREGTVEFKASVLPPLPVDCRSVTGLPAKIIIEQLILLIVFSISLYKYI